LRQLQVVESSSPNLRQPVDHFTLIPGNKERRRVSCASLQTLASLTLFLEEKKSARARARHCRRYPPNLQAAV